MNISAMALDEVRDKLAELDGWKKERVVDPALDGTFPAWVKGASRFLYGAHPIENTLDEAAKLPEGYRVERRNCRTMNRWCYDVWKKLPDGNWTCITIQLAEAGYLEYAPCIDTGDEKADRFPIRLACELAEKEAP